MAEGVLSLVACDVYLRASSFELHVDFSRAGELKAEAWNQLYEGWAVSCDPHSESYLR